MVYRPESVRDRLSRLEIFLNDLQELAVSDRRAFAKDSERRYAVERLLQLIAESAMDILDHVLSTRHGCLSETAEEVFSNAHTHGLLSDGLYGRLAGLGGFRNVLAHDYLRLNEELVFEHHRKLAGMADELLAELRPLSELPREG